MGAKTATLHKNDNNDQRRKEVILVELSSLTARFRSRLWTTMLDEIKGIHQ